MTVPVTIDPPLDGQHVTFAVVADSNESGTATVVGNPQLSSSGEIEARGGHQTTPGTAGGLRIRALLNGEPVGESPPFSVYAHPEAVEYGLLGPAALPLAVGMRVSVTVLSDSGDTAHLNEAVEKELVSDACDHTTSLNGVPKGRCNQNVNFKPAHTVPRTATPFRLLRPWSGTEIGCLVRPGAGRLPNVLGPQKRARSARTMRGRGQGGSAMLAASFPTPRMPTPEYVTTDFYLAAFLCHRGATLRGLRRLGSKRVEFRFETGEAFHDLLRLYWSGNLTPVVPWELFLCLRRLKCLSIDRYVDLSLGGLSAGTSPDSRRPDAQL